MAEKNLELISYTKRLDKIFGMEDFEAHLYVCLKEGKQKLIDEVESWYHKINHIYELGNGIDNDVLAEYVGASQSLLQDAIDRACLRFMKERLNCINRQLGLMAERVCFSVMSYQITNAVEQLELEVGNLTEAFVDQTEMVIEDIDNKYRVGFEDFLLMKYNDEENGNPFCW